MSERWCEHQQEPGEGGSPGPDPGPRDKAGTRAPGRQTGHRVGGPAALCAPGSLVPAPPSGAQLWGGRQVANSLTSRAPSNATCALWGLGLGRTNVRVPAGVPEADRTGPAGAGAARCPRSPRARGGVGSSGGGTLLGSVCSSLVKFCIARLSYGLNPQISPNFPFLSSCLWPSLYL